MRTNASTKLLIQKAILFTCAFLPALPIFAQTAAIRTNGRIAFTSDRHGNREIYSINPDGSDTRRLTFNPGIDDYPGWSSDGMKIAYLSESPSGQHAIKIMNADGSGQRIVTPVVFSLSTQNFCGERFSLGWSPDSNKIVFQEFGHIVTVNVDGTNRQNITNTSERESEPSWGQSGSIAYASTLDGGDGINGLDIQTSAGGVYAWYGYFTCSTSPDVSSDGKKLAYVHSNDFPPPGYITITPVDFNSFPTIDSLNFVGVMNVRWSPDGNYLVFTSSQQPQFNIEIIDQFGQGRRMLTQGANPSWQPLTSAACPNLIDCPDFFVRQHYLDFLDREPEPSGLAAWLGVLNNCAVGDLVCQHEQRLTTSAAFFGSPEFQLKGYFVFRFYQTAFARLPEYSEISADIRSVTGQTPEDVYARKSAFTNTFAQRLEFVTLFNGLPNADYVAALLGRSNLTSIITPDPSQPDGTTKVTLTQSQLVSHLEAGTLTRAQVLRAIANSDEVLHAEFNRAFVAMQYYGYLRRTPESTGYNSWLNYLNAHPGDFREMVRGFVDSTEYRSRFGQP